MNGDKAKSNSCFTVFTKIVLELLSQEDRVMS